MTITGICRKCEARRAAPEPLAPGRKVLLCLLTALAYAAIVPDFGRLLQYPSRVAAGGGQTKYLYPLGTLGFEADNDGKVVSVKSVDSEKAPKVHEDSNIHQEAAIDERDKKPKVEIGNLIDLKATSRSERRAVNHFVLVAYGKTHELHMLGRDKPLVLTPEAEQLSRAETWSLAFAQAAACLFIFFGAYLAWFRPGSHTWGFFLYSLWYNSGQYFFWYANLPDTWLCAFNIGQSIFEALGQTGLLLFALYYPRVKVDGWREKAAKYLWVMFIGLFAVRIWTFGNYFWGIQTQSAYFLWFRLTLLTLAIAFGLLLHSRFTQKNKGPQINWAIFGASTGLLCWVFADTYETVGIPSWTWLDTWVDVIYGCSVVLPISIFYAIWRFRAMNIRFAIRRTVVFFVITFILLVMFAVLHPVADELLKDNIKPFKEDWWLPFGIALSLTVVFLEHRSRHLVDHWMKLPSEKLRAIARKLAFSENVYDERELIDAVLNTPVEQLGLKCGAIYKRDSSGAFEHEKEFPNDIDCLLCNETVTSKLAPLPPGDTIFRLLIEQHESPKARQRYLSRRRRAAVDWSEVCQTEHDEAPPAKGVHVPLDWSRLHGTPDHTTPSYAIPIVRRQGDRVTITRILVLGPHARDYDLAPDEIKALEELCVAAGTAYLALENRNNVAPASEQRPKSSRKSSRKRR